VGPRDHEHGAYHHHVEGSFKLVSFESSLFDSELSEHVRGGGSEDSSSNFGEEGSLVHLLCVEVANEFNELHFGVWRDSM